MEELSREEFLKMKKKAGDTLMQMHSNGMPPVPDFVKVPKKEEVLPSEPPASGDTPSTTRAHESGSSLPFLRYLNLPEITKNRDGILLLALILLLSHENADDRLVLALAYILL